MTEPIGVLETLKENSEENNASVNIAMQPDKSDKSKVKSTPKEKNEDGASIISPEQEAELQKSSHLDVRSERNGGRK